MDDRRFDALVKSLAAGKNRRSLLKGLLGLGGAAVTGGALFGEDVRAARRPTPTPKPPSCPGGQIPCPTGCCCPTGQTKCGPDCCTEETIPAPQPGHSECCDNACCFGTCYGEELCCATNNRSSGEFPIPPTNKICQSIDNGTQCCGFDQDCCEFDGCCDTVCWGAGPAFCCPNDPGSFCRGGGEVEDICCVNSGDQIFACCNGGTNARVCYDTSAEGACCTDADCGDPCQICNPATNICESRCGAGTVCCTEQAGPGVCVTGECCLGVPSCDTGSICCQGAEGTVCVAGDTCESRECDRCLDGGLDCCFINDVFAGCYDQGAEGACCTAATCGLDDFDNCLTSACIDFACQQVSTCLDDQYCCDGECSDDVCDPPGVCESNEDCGTDTVCCVGLCCQTGQVCVDIGGGVLNCVNPA